MIRWIMYWFVRNFASGVFDIDLRGRRMRRGDTIHLIDNEKVMYLGNGKFRSMLA